jgi:hypothetical protein
VKTRRDSTAPKVLSLEFRRSIQFSNSPHVSHNRYVENGDAHLSFSSCGRYIVTAQSSRKDHLKADATLWSIRSSYPPYWQRIPITNAEKFDFPASKVSVNFDNFNPVCVVTFWVQPDSDLYRVLCSVRCFIFDLEKATITHCLHPISIYLEGNSIPSPDTQGFSFNESPREDWIAQMDMMERSSVLSRCGQYLILSATIGAERFQMIIDLPSKEKSSSKEPATGSTGQTNPRVIEPKMTYWYQHRYRKSVYHQRILLHRSIRSVTDRNTFSSLSCHVQLSVLPAHLADAKTWLLIPESNGAPMTILVTTKDHPPELWKLPVSWDAVVGKLRDLEGEHGNAIVTLDK